VPPAPTASIVNFNFQDVTVTALGLTWTPAGPWTFRLGVAKNNSAAPDAYRAPAIPDNGATWYAAGIGYAFSKTFRVDLSLVHDGQQECSVNLTTQPDPADPNFFRGNLKATAKVHADLASISCHVRF
jgi:long-subunit fatty acid transport protein